MRRKTVFGFAKLLIISLCCSLPSSLAQDQTTAETKTEASNKPVDAYRLDFSVNELEDGKKINTRQYSMYLDADDGPNTLKIGTRVPVEGKPGEFQYIDVGINLWSRLKERPNGLQMEVRGEISNLAMPDQATHGYSIPVVRQMQINASTLALVGKPMVVGSVDDPDSKRQFQLEVTVTRLK
jgi:hypothetical protein